LGAIQSRHRDEGQVITVQTTDSNEGHFVTFPISQDTVLVGDGSKILHLQYRQFLYSDDPSNSIHNLIATCWGSAVLREDETTVGAGGGCHMTDSEGSGYWQTWQLDEAGTQRCPVRCGTSEDRGGYGRFEGLLGKGNWEVYELFPDGSAIGRSVGTIEWR